MNKKFHIDSLFTITKAEGDASADDSIQIVGYANTVDKDRHGDVIIPEAWKKGGIMNYLKNPILLAYHDHSKPIGRVIEISVDDKGLKVVAEVFSAAKEVYEFVKKGVLKAFSIGAAIKDADYNRETDIFVIKDLELLEISIVSVPANQDSLFSLAKGFDSSDFDEFKKQFLPQEDVTKELTNSEGKDKDDLNMNEEQLAALAKSIADATVKAQAEVAAEAKAKAEKAATEKAAIISVQDNTQKLVEEITKRFEQRMSDNTIAMKDVVAGLEGQIKEKASEIDALMKNKMQFRDSNAGDKVSYDEKETAYFLSKVIGKSMKDTQYGSRILTKASGAAGPHVTGMTDGSEWETEVSNNLLADLRKKLIMAPLFRNINMPLSVMRFPVNPEAGYAGWVNKTDYASAASTGVAATHGLTNITLETYKLATKEFISTEEEEDTIIPLVPIIRDAIVRRMAKAHDRSLLRGGTVGATSVTSVAVSSADPIAGVANIGAYTATRTTKTTSGTVAVADLIAMRRKLGVWGLEPSELVFIVSQDVYYDLLEDTNFLTVDKIGSDRAVLRTGQIGSVLGVPVILSGEFAAKGAGAMAATIVYAPNFISGEQRGLTMESEYRIEQQEKLLVATRRLAFKQVSSANGTGAASLVWS